MFGSLLLLGFQSVALGAEVLVVPRDATALPGRTTQLELVAWEQGGPLDSSLVEATSRLGSVLRLTSHDEAGLYSLKYRSPATGGVQDEIMLRFDDGTEAVATLDVGVTPEASLSGPEQVEALAGGSDALSLDYEFEGGINPADVDVSASEGRVVDVRVEADRLIVDWVADSGREPRVVFVGVRDLRRQGVPPVWTRVRLRARAPVAVQTEPGSQLTVSVGGREYGPVAADESGQAVATVDVYPGENLAYAELVDSLGNSQKTTISLGVVPSPALAAHVEGSIEPGGAPPVIHLTAARANGRPWRGAFPVCRPAGGDLLEVTDLGSAQWVTEVRTGLNNTGFDLRVDCLLLGTVVPVRVPVSRGTPARMVLRVYPTELSADFPIAQVQASMEDHSGERLSARGIELQASHGSLSIRESASNVVRADYEGDSNHPSSYVSATWKPESSGGIPALLDVVARRDGDRLVAEVVASTRKAVPVSGVALSVEANGERIEGTSDSNGRFVAEFVSVDDPSVVRATGGRLEAATLYIPWLEADSPYGVHQPLQAGVDLEIRAGRVRNVYLSAEPSELFVGQGVTAELHVRLLDGSGALVMDEEVALKADAGSIGELFRRQDGTLGAVYSPPGGQWSGQVVVTATASDTGFSASTPVTLRPRPLDSSVTIGVGPLATAKRDNKALVTFDAERRVEIWEDRLHLRGSLNLWADQSTVEDSSRGTTVELDMDIFCISMAALIRRESGVYASWFGIGGTLTPYFLETRFEGLEPLKAWGLHGLGVTSMIGVGRRFALGELIAEGRFLGVIGKGTDVGYEGQLGGAALVLGYRVIL